MSLRIIEGKVPYYLRGYDAIEKEIAVISNRPYEIALLMADGYEEIRDKIVAIQSDLASSQLRKASELIKVDNPNDWIDLDTDLADSVSQKKTLLILTLSIILGGFFGTAFVLIRSVIKK